MATFIAATTLSPDVVTSPNQYEALEREVMEQIRQDCPDVRWKANYTLMGPFDYLDVFEAPSVDEAVKVAAVLRSRARAKVEVWPAKSWQRFKELMNDIDAR